MKLATVVQACKNRGYIPVEVVEADDQCDAALMFIGWHIQVGANYICFITDLPNNKFLFSPTFRVGNVSTLQAVLTLELPKIMSRH